MEQTTADEFELIDSRRDNTEQFDSWEDAQERMNDMVDLGASPEDFQIQAVGDSTDGETAQADTTDTTESDTVAVVDEANDKSTEGTHSGIEKDTVQTEPENIPAELPQITPVEDKARSIINQLDHADMTRLVWDPKAAGNTVPYDPQGLPYDTAEPSAEAFDMFATIIEGESDVTYSVVDVDFTVTDETLGCTVVIEKQTGDSTKRLVGVKTRSSKHYDHWRERLYSKARRNALKQDIPPTWISTLLRRYKSMSNAEN